MLQNHIPLTGPTLDYEGVAESGVLASTARRLVSAGGHLCHVGLEHFGHFAPARVRNVEVDTTAPLDLGGWGGGGGGVRG